MTRELKNEISRLYHTEMWPVWKISRHLNVTECEVVKIIYGR